MFDIWFFGAHNAVTLLLGLLVWRNTSVSKPESEEIVYVFVDYYTNLASLKYKCNITAWTKKVNKFCDALSQDSRRRNGTRIGSQANRASHQGLRTGAQTGINRNNKRICKSYSALWESIHKRRGLYFVDKDLLKDSDSIKNKFVLQMVLSKHFRIYPGVAVVQCIFSPGYNNYRTLIINIFCFKKPNINCFACVWIGRYFGVRVSRRLCGG